MHANSVTLTHFGVPTRVYDSQASSQLATGDYILATTSAAARPFLETAGYRVFISQGPAPRVRIHASPPRCLDFREDPLLLGENPVKSPVLREICFKNRT